jgi:rRNA maturation endonuclease Nob1
VRPADSLCHPFTIFFDQPVYMVNSYIWSSGKICNRLRSYGGRCVGCGGFVALGDGGCVRFCPSCEALGRNVRHRPHSFVGSSKFG